MPNNTSIIDISRITSRRTLSEDVNAISYQKLIIDTETQRNNRAELDTGTFCDCEFCYYTDQLHIKTSLDVIKERADYLLAYGITQVDLSGGESSVSPDWFDILDYCNERFEHVSCLSHGGKFANMEFLKKSQEHGLKEVLFSLHGATEEVHDTITRRKGSFVKILQAIKNAQELDIVVRLNCTVYYRNYHQLEDIYSELVNGIKPFEVNFITLNYWDDVQLDRPNVTYKEMTDHIKKCIDRLNKDAIINVRYVPFCYMKGYEKYVCGQFQHIYDIYDWNKEMYIKKDGTRVDVTKQYTHEEKLGIAYSHCAEYRTRFYRKDVSCLTCKHFYICDGVEKEIDNPEVFPEAGEKIKEVVFYRKNHFK
jgi:MoaA/NifB/PqqE/SkfB family radical SAM enzyme